MIQRIQTLYLLVISILAGLTLLLPVAELINTADNLKYGIDFKGIYLIDPIQGHSYLSNALMLPFFIGLVMVISLYSILKFKNRMLQIRLSVINFLFMIGYYIALIIYLWLAGKNLESVWHLKFTAAFPMICIILNYLVIGAIGKDEALVKSADRLR